MELLRKENSTMKITIIGWYGTETIGDRAILAGLLSFFQKAYADFEIHLGSLYPFFSERTINEDYKFYQEIMKQDVKITLFDSKDSKALLGAIKKSHLLVMGGGPLMDMDELFMLEYAFKKAQKMGVKTALLGAGIGPLFQKKYRKSVLEISLKSDLIILRDKRSKSNLEEIYIQFNKTFIADTVYTSFDPAVEAVLQYKNIEKCVEQKPYIAVNLRAFPQEYNDQKSLGDIDTALKKFTLDLSLKYKEQEIRLIPMHYFHIGGDDRSFLNSIALELEQENIKVQNKPLNLKETIAIYEGASFNIGMRFHSVVLQTIVSGKNYVLDYTEPKRGKIAGFLADIDTKDFFEERYISLQEDKIDIEMIRNIDMKFLYKDDEIEKKLEVYIQNLKMLFL